MKIISTRARVTAFLLGVLTSALVLGGTLVGITDEDEAATSDMVMERPATTTSVS